MPTVTPTAARDSVAPALHKAQETLAETVLPTVRDAIATAFEKSGEILDSDMAWEARRRGTAIVKAAKGDMVVAATPMRRWRFGLGMLGLGAGLGFGLSWLMKKMSTPVDSYQSAPTTIPVPSGTDGGASGSGSGTTSSSGGSASFSGSTGAASSTGAAGGMTPMASDGAAPATADTAISDIDLTSGARGTR